MTGSTRRGFLAGAAAGAVAPRALAAAPAVAADGPPEAAPKIVRHGRAIAVSPGGHRLVVAHERRRTIAIARAGGHTTRFADVGGQPVDVAVAPGGRLAAVSTGFWDEPGVALVELSTAAVLTRLDAGPAPGAVAFTPDGERLVVAGGEQEGSLHVIDVGRRKVVRTVVAGLVPRGLALARGGAAAWVALNGDDSLALVDLHSGRVVRTLRTPALPDRIALAPGGGRMLVTHGGRDASHVSEIDLGGGALRRHGVGRLPSAVAWTRGGRRLVALGGASAVVELGRARRRHRVGPAPRGLAVAGRRFWTVSALTGEISGGRA